MRSAGCSLGSDELRVRARARYGAKKPGKDRDFRRTASGTENGNPTTTARPRTRFCAVRLAVQPLAAGAISVESSPLT